MKEKIKIINFNSHAVKILPPSEVDFTVPVKEKDIPILLSKCDVIQSSGNPKISISRTPSKHYSNVKINDSNIGLIEGLPDEVEGTILVVPSIVYNALHRIRKDIYVIDEPIRSEKGTVICCRSIARPHYTIDNKIVEGITLWFKMFHMRILNSLKENDVNNSTLKAFLEKEEPGLLLNILKLVKLVK